MTPNTALNSRLVLNRLTVAILTAIAAFQMWFFESLAPDSKYSPKHDSVSTEIILKSWETPFPLAGADSTATLHSFLSESSNMLIVVFSLKECFTCFWALPAINDFYKRRHDQKVSVVAVAQAPTRNYLKYLVQKAGISFPVLFDSTFSFKGDNAITQTPIALLFDTHKRMILGGWIRPNERNEDLFLAKVDSVLLLGLREKSR